MRLTSLLPAALCTASLFAQSAWETPSSPGTSRGGRAPSPALAERESFTEQLYGDSETYGPRYGYMPEELVCQTLDAQNHPLSFATATFSPEAQFGDFGKAATFEFEGAWRMFAFEEFLAGYLEGSLDARFLSYLSNPDMSALPDVATHLALDLSPSWRFVNGWSMEWRVAPGIYSDIAAPQFNCPTTLNFHYAVTPQLGGLGGLTVRPGWDLPVMPNLGLAWQPNPAFRLEAMLPRSQVVLSPFEAFAVFGTLEWRNFDFALDDEEGGPEAYTVDEWLATAGLAIGMDPDNRLTVEFGTYLGRELSADVAENSTVEISKEWLLRFGWHGAF